eukprot:512482-Pyramimonas_sp.AAC.1
MSSAKPIDSETSSGHAAGIMNVQTKDWLSAEATAQPFVSRSMGSQKGTVGRTDRGLSERGASASAAARPQISPILPNKKHKKASETMPA